MKIVAPIAALFSVTAALKRVEIQPSIEDSIQESLDDAGRNFNDFTSNESLELAASNIAANILSPNQNKIVSEYQKIYDNDQPIAYMHNHGKNGEVITNNRGKDYSDKSELTKVSAKVDCVLFCKKLLNIVMTNELGQSSIDVYQANPNMYNSLMTTCMTECKVAYRHPKAVDENWQISYAGYVMEYARGQL